MYTFTLSESELDLVLAALGIFGEDEATTLMVRLDNAASQQERDRIRMPDGSLSASRFIAECDRRDKID